MAYRKSTSKYCSFTSSVTKRVHFGQKHTHTHSHTHTLTPFNFTLYFNDPYSSLARGNWWPGEDGRKIVSHSQKDDHPPPPPLLRPWANPRRPSSKTVITLIIIIIIVSKIVTGHGGVAWTREKVLYKLPLLPPTSWHSTLYGRVPSPSQATPVNTLDIEEPTAEWPTLSCEQKSSLSSEKLVKKYVFWLWNF